MKLPDETYEFIKGEVAFLLKKCEIKHIPISGLEIASKLNISIQSYSSLDEDQQEVALRLSEDGFFLEDRYGNNTIYYNDNGRSYSRINMTILHEIGHCVLDHSVSAYGNSDIEEAEARFFAKYMAALPPLVDIIHPQSPNDIKQCFDISREAAKFAFDYYKKWRASKKTNEEKDYERIIIELFVTANDSLRRRRFNEYAKLLQLSGGDARI